MEQIGMNGFKSLFAGGIASLALLAVPAHGQVASPADGGPGAGRNIAVIGEPPPLYPSVGQMNDHMHDRGQVMVGIRLERSRSSGPLQSGTHTVGDEDLLMAGYMMRGKSMSMDMVMLDLMYAPSDQVTLTLSPQYMWNRMKMVGLNGPMISMGSMSSMGSMPMAEMDETTRGFGDTFAAASVRLVRRPHLKAHATLGVWIPTGAVDRKDAMGTLLDYSMQLGSGTWDLEPSATISGDAGPMGWGLLASYRWRAERRNDEGFRFGDRAQLSGWLSYLVRPTLGFTARAEYDWDGRIHGEYSGPHNAMMSPSDEPANYGGRSLTGSFGVNWQPWSKRRGTQLGAEVGIPLYQKVHGAQMPRKWRATMAIRQMF
jgi:hypothetical protein